jgi:hypothetical protein
MIVINIPDVLHLPAIADKHKNHAQNEMEFQVVLLTYTSKVWAKELLAVRE